MYHLVIIFIHYLTLFLPSSIIELGGKDRDRLILLLELGNIVYFSLTYIIIITINSLQTLNYGNGVWFRDVVIINIFLTFSVGWLVDHSYFISTSVSLYSILPFFLYSTSSLSTCVNYLCCSLCYTVHTQHVSSCCVVMLT